MILNPVSSTGHITPVYSIANSAYCGLNYNKEYVVCKYSLKHFWEPNTLYLLTHHLSVSGLMLQSNIGMDKSMIIRSSALFCIDTSVPLVDEPTLIYNNKAFSTTSVKDSTDPNNIFSGFFFDSAIETVNYTNSTWELTIFIKCAATRLSTTTANIYNYTITGITNGSFGQQLLAAYKIGNENLM